MNNQKIGDISIKNNKSTGNSSIGAEIHNVSDNTLHTGLNEQILTAVPYIVHESAVAREERHVKRLVISLIISIITLFLSNLGWLLYLSQYEFVEESIELTADSGNANYIGNDGDINNGEN